MDGDRGRRLRAALLVVGVSTGLGAWAAPPVSAMMPPIARHALWRQREGRVLARGALAARLGAAAALNGMPWTQQAELTSTAQQLNDGYGWAVAVSGNTAVVAASDTPPWPSPAYGAVYIFTRTTSGVWSQQAELLDPGYGGAASDGFGTAVALSGTTLAVSAPGATGGLGAVYIYGRTGSTWTQQAVITPTDATRPENFATALALSGNTLVVGANYQNTEGAIYIFAYNGHTWTQQAELAYPGHYLNADFGNSVAVWGNTVLVAAPGTPVAFVYARSGSTWALQAVLSAPHSSFAFFGHDVALWGNTALVGVCCFNTHVNGAVEVYTRSGTTWSLRATLTAPGGALNGNFGTAVALSGNTAVVTGSGAFVYVGSGATWTFQAQLMPTDRPPTVIGAAAALQGNTALIGATGVPPAGYVFVRSGSDSPWTDTARPALLTTRARSVHMR